MGIRRIGAETQWVEPGRWDTRIEVRARAELAERSAHSIQASPESQRENAVLKISCNAGRTKTALGGKIGFYWISALSAA